MAATHKHIKRRKWVCARQTNAFVFDARFDWSQARPNQANKFVTARILFQCRLWCWCRTHSENRSPKNSKINPWRWKYLVVAADERVRFLLGLRRVLIQMKIQRNADVWVKTIHRLVEQVAEWRAPLHGFSRKFQLHRLESFAAIQWDGAAYAVRFRESNWSASEFGDGQMTCSNSSDEMLSYNKD